MNRLGSSSITKKKYEKYDISKYEIPKTKYEALRISSKLVYNFFWAVKKISYFEMSYFLYFFVMEDDAEALPSGVQITNYKLQNRNFFDFCLVRYKTG